MIRHLRQELESTTLWAGWDLGLRQQAIEIVDGVMSYRGGGCFSQSIYLFLETGTLKDFYEELLETTCSITQ